jgi:hypothetical protein
VETFRLSRNWDAAQDSIVAVVICPVSDAYSVIIARWNANTMQWDPYRGFEGDSIDSIKEKFKENAGGWLLGDYSLARVEFFLPEDLMNQPVDSEWTYVNHRTNREASIGETHKLAVRNLYSFVNQGGDNPDNPFVARSKHHDFNHEPLACGADVHREIDRLRPKERVAAFVCTRGLECHPDGFWGSILDVGIPYGVWIRKSGDTGGLSADLLRHLTNAVKPPASTIPRRVWELRLERQDLGIDGHIGLAYECGIVPPAKPGVGIL